MAMSAAGGRESRWITVRIAVSPRISRARARERSLGDVVGDLVLVEDRVQRQLRGEQDLGDVVVEVVGDPLALLQPRELGALLLVALGGVVQRGDVGHPHERSRSERANGSPRTRIAASVPTRIPPSATGT